jgi:hypothetical protein
VACMMGKIFGDCWIDITKNILTFHLFTFQEPPFISFDIWYAMEEYWSSPAESYHNCKNGAVSNQLTEWMGVCVG